MTSSGSDWAFVLTSLHGQTIERLEGDAQSYADDLENDKSQTPIQETESLLDPFASSSWTLHSPYWSLTSKILLQITYRPAWQAIPFYTNISLSEDCARRTCCANGHKSVEFSSVNFTTDDIVRLEHIQDMNIRGIVGPCKGLRLYLREKPMPIAEMPPKFHPYLHAMCSIEDHQTHSWDRMEERADNLGDPNHSGPLITFAMPCLRSADQYAPPLLWKVYLPQNPDVSLESLTILQGSLEVVGSKTEPTHIYINGYQSWSFSGSVVKGAPQPSSGLPEVYSKAFNLGGSPPPSVTTLANHSHHLAPLQNVHYHSDFFACITSDGHVPEPEEIQLKKFPFQALDEAGGPALVVGWLAQHHQYGVIEATKDLKALAMHVSLDNTIIKKPVFTDWAYAELIPPHGYDEEPMVHYLHATASHNVARPLQNGPILTGWCSWYHYYEKITAANLRDNFGRLQSMRNKVPTNVAVVDDGYMTAWGDWDSLKPYKFPHGLKGVADDIRACGMRPGLWLAPFAADKKSKLAKNHPDWIIRNDEGRIANSSYCGKFFYGLDVTNPHVREYVYSCVRRAVRDWGFNVLKVDFLYACCLKGNGKYDLSISRAEAMNLALQTIRAAAGPDVFLIGCGCPIGPGIGYIDANRISADTGPSWYPEFPLPYWDQGTLPALRAMIRNSISRAPLGHRWWHNDPDCLLLGMTTRLTDFEVASAASIVAMTCGMLLLSDDLTRVPLTRMRIASKIYPMTGASAVVLDLHSTNDGLPSLLRLWCTDRYQPVLRPEDQDFDMQQDFNFEATLLARRASFDPDSLDEPPSDRIRSCIHVAEGMGTWTLLSVSNWSDKPAVVRVPHSALLPPPARGWNEESDVRRGDHGSVREDGFHIFSFWSGDYQWMPDPRTKEGERFDLKKLLHPHETEIFHIKPVSPNMPDYIGSAIHFSCGYEVSTIARKPDSLTIQLRKDFYRLGYAYLYIPRPKLDEMQVTVAGVTAAFESVGNTPAADDQNRLAGKVIRLPVVVRGDGSENDGKIVVKF
jgi:alpha-galactosidase